MTVTADQDRRVVAIFKDEGAYIVAPGQLIAKVGDEVCFQNLTGISVTIRFPNKELFERDELTLDPGEDKPEELRNPQAGGYSYNVYCDGKEKEAHASMPRVIVYRKLA